MSDSVWPHSWDSPGKNTGVGCHFLLQCIKVKSESEVAQSCLSLQDCSLPGSSVHGIFQARVLEWGAIAFSGSLPTSPQITLPLAQNFPTTSIFSLFFPSFPTHPPMFSLYFEHAKPLHTSFILVFTKFSLNITFLVKLPSTPLYHRLWVIRQISYVIIYLMNAISSRLWAPYRGLISFVCDYISLPRSGSDWSQILNRCFQ